jgi:hypothetical protein
MDRKESRLTGRSLIVLCAICSMSGQSYAAVSESCVAGDLAFGKLTKTVREAYAARTTSYCDGEVLFPSAGVVDTIGYEYPRAVADRASTVVLLSTFPLDSVATTLRTQKTTIRGVSTDIQGNYKLDGEIAAGENSLRTGPESARVKLGLSVSRISYVGWLESSRLGRVYVPIYVGAQRPAQPVNAAKIRLRTPMTLASVSASFLLPQSTSVAIATVAVAQTLHPGDVFDIEVPSNLIAGIYQLELELLLPSGRKVISPQIVFVKP